MLYNNKTQPGSYELEKQGNADILRINCHGYPYLPSIEDNAIGMANVMDKLIEVPSAQKIILVDRRNYEYDYEQTRMLMEIANLYRYLVKDKKIFSLGVSSDYFKVNIQSLIINTLRSDPVGVYVELKRLIRDEKIKIENTEISAEVNLRSGYLELLTKLLKLLENTKLISSARPYLAGHEFGSRNIYKQIIKPSVTPDFMFTRLMASPPLHSEEIDAYSIEKIEVNIFKIPEQIQYLYHVTPPEFKLSEDKYELLDIAKNALSEHKPEKNEFIDPERMRQTFYNIGKDLIQELAESKGIQLKYKEINELAEILVRYTVGFGLIEILLEDPKIQDITINGPIGESPIFVVHEEYHECITNLYPDKEDGESWASKFRILSGRPLDEANPVLDTELVLPKARARVAIMNRPLNPVGLAFAFRRHRDQPWTYPLFIKNKMLSPLAAGLLSFLVDGNRTLLFAGTRSSGKCVEGGTLVQLNDGNIKPIKSIIEGEKKQIENDTIYTPKENKKIMSLKGHKVTEKNIENYWQRKSPEYLIKIKTRSGKELITTKEHPYFAYNKGMKSIFAEFLEKGQLIATPRKVNIKNERQKIELKTFDGFEEYEDYYIIKGVTNSKKVYFPKYMTEEFSEFIGYLLSDGYIDKTKIEFTNSDEKLRENYKHLIGTFRLHFKEFKSRNTFNIQISSRLLSRAISQTFNIPLGNKAKKIEIPEIILKSDNKTLAVFIKAYFDSEAHIRKLTRDLEVVSASETIIKQIQLCLLRYEIVSSIKKKVIKKGEYYRLFIRGEFINKYQDEIGFNHPDKKRVLKDLINKNIIDNTNTDTIPEGNKILKDLRKKLRITPLIVREETLKDIWAYENNQYRATRKWFKILVNSYNKKHNELKKLKSNASVLKEFLNYDFDNFGGFISSFNNLKKILNKSYVEISKNLDFSEAELRFILQNKIKNLNINNINSLKKTYLNLANKFDDYKKDIYNLDCVDIKNTFRKINLDYAYVSKETSIPETSLKSYFYGNIKVPKERELHLIKFFEGFKDLSIKNMNKIEKEIDNMKRNYGNDLVNFSVIYSNLILLKEKLNIMNKELTGKGTCLGNISNLFIGKYKKPHIKTLKILAKSIVDIYEEAVSGETEELLDAANNLANSDIFWDEIISTEKIEPKEEFVYDLTISDTHNFIANGIFVHNTSLLGSTLVEIMRKYRILTIEDTEEIPVDALRKLNYNIQPMKVKSALTKTSAEMEAGEGIRTSLRFGDSALIVGEIRSTEAAALWEAMRIGALSNVVAGTIHGADPYGVFDRVVNDLKIPRTSFKATDIIIVSNPIRTADGLHKQRRILSISEVRKHWEKDPIREKGFVDLMKYNSKTDMLEPTQDLINGDSEIIKEIAGNVKEWMGNWQAVWDNILLRAKIKETLVDYAVKLNQNDILEAKFVVESNDMFHRISDSVREDLGYLDSKRIFFEWNEWVKRTLKKSMA